MCLLFLLFALTLDSTANACGVYCLKAFISGAKTAEADFTQTVSSKSGKITQQASGKMAFALPQDTTFEQIRMGFKGDVLAQMELADNFGQRTTLKFSRFERNPNLSPTRFKFTPPKGADVISD